MGLSLPVEPVGTDWTVGVNVKTSNARHETRDGVLIAVALDMVARTSLSQDGFAEQLNYQLHDKAPQHCADKGYPDLQAMTKTADVVTYGRAYKAWSKRVERWLNGDVEIPVCIEEAWVSALEQPWRDRALTQLSSRYGLLPVRQCGMNPGDAMQVFAQLSTSFGQAAQVGGVVFADGVLDARDAEHAPELAQWCRQLAAAASAMAERAEKQTIN